MSILGFGDQDAPDDDDAGVDDLSGVLVHIAPVKLEPARRRITNSEDTWQFLEGGLDLLRHDLLDHTGADLTTGAAARLFASLSMKRVVGAAQARSNGRNGVLPTEGRFKQRWPHHARFAEDLIAFLFRLAPQQRRLRQITAYLDRLPAQMTLHELVRQLADTELRGVFDDRNTGLRIVVQGAMPNHERVRAYVAATYEQILPMWAGIYEKIGTMYGLQPRPPYTWLDLAVMFDAVLEGTALRARCQPDAAFLSAGDSILAGTVLALLPGVLDDYDGQDRNRILPPPQPPESTG